MIHSEQAVESVISRFHLLKALSEQLLNNTEKDSINIEFFSDIQEQQAAIRTEISSIVSSDNTIFHNERVRQLGQECLAIEQKVNLLISDLKSYYGVQLQSLNAGKKARRTYDSHSDSGFGFFVDRQK